MTLLVSPAATAGDKWQYCLELVNGADVIPIICPTKQHATTAANRIAAAIEAATGKKPEVFFTP